MLLGIVLILLLLVSTIGFSLFSGVGNNSGASEDGNVNEGFVKEGDYWVLRLGSGNEENKQEFYFSYSPEEILSGEVSIDINDNISLQKYYNKPLYLMGNSINSRAAVEILNNLGRYVLRYQEACINLSNYNIDCVSDDIPYKNCSDNSIVFVNSANSLESNSTSLWVEDNCVFIEGDFVLGADAFLYRTFGII